MKIVQRDNFDRENISESLIAENVPLFWAEKIVTFLNDEFSGPESPFYCAAKPDDYKLYVFEP